MLNYNQVESALPVALELQEKNLKLEAIPGPLALLVSEFSVATAISSSVEANDEEALANYIPQVVATLVETSGSTMRTDAGSVLDQSHHDVKMDEFSDLICTGVLATYAKARSVCIPAITRLETAIGELLHKHEDRSLANVGIDEVGIDEVLDNDEVFEYFSQYQNLRLTPVKAVNIFPNMQPIDLAKLIESGSPEVNKHLTDSMMLTSATGDLASFVYNQLFLGSELNGSDASLGEFRNLAKTLFGDCCGIESLMIAYYLAKGLLANLPDGVNAGIREVEDRVNSMTRMLGLMIYSEIVSYRDSVKNKTLFPVGLPYADATGRVNVKYNIRVNREVYHGFLADGGSPEVIYGTMVSDRCVDPSVLIANADKYTKAYQHYVDINRAYTTSSRLSLYRDAIRDEAYKMVSDTEYLKSFDASSGVFVRLRNNLERMGADHIASPENTYMFLRSLVCQMFYPDDPAVEKVISDVDNFEGEEGLSVAEVGTFVLCDLIVDWLCKQVKVERGV